MVPSYDQKAKKNNDKTSNDNFDMRRCHVVFQTISKPNGSCRRRIKSSEECRTSLGLELCELSELSELSVPGSLAPWLPRSLAPSSLAPWLGRPGPREAGNGPAGRGRIWRIQVLSLSVSWLVYLALLRAWKGFWIIFSDFFRNIRPTHWPNTAHKH